MAKRSSKGIGDEGENLVVDWLKPLFPEAYRVKRPDYGIQDTDVVADRWHIVEVKTSNAFFSQTYQGALEKVERDADTVRPTAKYPFLVVQDRPGRGRARTRHVVFDGEVWKQRELALKECIERLEAEVKNLGGADALVAALAVARDRKK